MKFLTEMDSLCCGRFDLRTGTLVILWVQLLCTIFDIMTIGPRMTYTSTEGYVAQYIVVSSVLLALTCALGIYGVGFDARKHSFLLPYVIVEVAVTFLVLIVDVILICIWIVDAPIMENFVDDLYLKPRALSGKRPSQLPASFFAFCTCFGLAICCLVLWFFASVIYSYYLLLKEAETSTRRCSVQRSNPRSNVNKPDPHFKIETSGNINRTDAQ